MEDRFLHLVDELNVLVFRICALIFVERRMYMHAPLTEAFAEYTSEKHRLSKGSRIQNKVTHMK